MEEICKIMHKKRNIRNLTLIGQLNCGKSMLTDSLLNKAGIVAGSKVRKTRAIYECMDIREEGEITVKSTLVI